MLNNYLKYLKLISKQFRKEKKIFDIVAYGSSVRNKENPNDLDIVIICTSSSFNDRLSLAQEFKERIKSKIKNPDVKAINLTELFDKNFLARQGILVDGYSLFDSIFISKKLGFNGYSLFTYNLKKLDHNKKTQFTYSLIGRRKEGILKLINAVYLGKGVIAIPSENSSIFEDFLKKWNVDYKEKKILIAEKWYKKIKLNW